MATSTSYSSIQEFAGQSGLGMSEGITAASACNLYEKLNAGKAGGYAQAEWNLGAQFQKRKPALATAYDKFCASNTIIAEMKNQGTGIMSTSTSAIDSYCTGQYSINKKSSACYNCFKSPVNYESSACEAARKYCQGSSSNSDYCKFNKK
jgi:hypothetical protein